MASLSHSDMKSGETVHEYTDRITRLCGRLGLPLPFLQDFFIKGLPLEMQVYIRAGNPENFIQIKAKAREFEQMHKHSSTQARGVSFNAIEDTLNSQSMILSAFTTLANEVKTMKAFIATPETNSRERGRSNDFKSSSSRYNSAPSSNRETARGDSRDRGRGDRNRTPTPGRDFRQYVSRGNSQSPSASYQSDSYRGHDSQTDSYERRRTPSRDRRDSAPRREERSYQNRAGSGDRQRSSSLRTTSPGYSPDARDRGNRSNSAGWPPPLSTVRCYNCNKDGHFWRNCPENRNSSLDAKTRNSEMRAFLALEETNFQAGLE